MSNKVVAAMLLMTGFVAIPLCAGSSSATLSVSVQVLARTIVTVDSQPSTVSVTAADVARGYVDLPQSVVFHVRSNAANGYAMQFEPIGFPFSRADVTWDSASATIGSEGAWLSEPYEAGTHSGAFNVRLELAPGTQPGAYDWPVRFDAGSL